MPFVWVAADDSPGPNSVRAYIERNAIGLLSRISPLGLTADPPSSNWLGSRCQNQTVRESGLWNVKHTECRYDRSFLTCLEKYVDETVAGGPGLCKSRTIALVGCVKSKRDHAAETRSLYTSALFIKAAAYAQRAADDWYILSAKHGLLSPHQIIAPYEQTLKGASSRDRSVWAGRVYEQMRAAGLLASRTRFLWLAGKMYQYPLITYLEDHEHIDPLKGLGIGARLQWLTANSRK
jgi:hypothetical protein